jgi:CheY-like chemotaxis protein
MQTPAKILETPVTNDMTSILLVDDDVRNLDVLESILDSPQLRLVRTQTPEEALLALVHSEFACIILDINPPAQPANSDHLFNGLLFGREGYSARIRCRCCGLPHQTDQSGHPEIQG